MRKPLVNVATDIRARFLAYARANSLALDLVLARFAFERLFARPSRSAYAERFVLRGRVLVIVWFDEARRGTSDLGVYLGGPDRDAGRIPLTVAA
ncbi:MAG: hypothetical protein AB7I79_24330 [Rhizobiaceae bacterium]